MSRLAPTLTNMINTHYGSMFGGDLGYQKGQALKELLQSGSVTLGALMSLGFDREAAQKILGWKADAAESFGDGSYEFTGDRKPLPNTMPSWEQRQQALSEFPERSGEPVPTTYVNSAPPAPLTAPPTLPGYAQVPGLKPAAIKTGDPRAGMHRGDRRMGTPLEVLEGRGQVAPVFDPTAIRRYY